MSIEEKDIPEEAQALRREIRRVIEKFKAMKVPAFLSLIVGDYMIHGASGTLDQLVALQINAAHYLAEKMKEEDIDRLRAEPGMCQGDCSTCPDRPEGAGHSGGETIQ